MSDSVTLPWEQATQLFKDLTFMHAWQVIKRDCECSVTGVACDVQVRINALAPLVERRSERRAH